MADCKESAHSAVNKIVNLSEKCKRLRDKEVFAFLGTSKEPARNPVPLEIGAGLG